ncbi:hypothetical protein E6W39_24310 [Kitasatospora acidiphila]|uniref:Uncharacterized protein n=1 Tax=Kitasatospora acidiphila TaxID=2567942 RepID=A0A540W6X2_9ACTN|nr:hypothetical protein [Kitasatospora acidiphila]TQF04778.1 hypothetical protein E6W39_24310 [Kitasatospora acidiphila]
MAEHPAVAFLGQAWAQADRPAPGRRESAAQIYFNMVYGPAAVRHRIAVERQIFHEHRPTRTSVNGPWSEPGCRTCCKSTEEPSLPALWPCRTVLLAEAWGWEA